MLERVPLDDLLLLVSVDDGVQTLKNSTTHQIPDALLLYTESLDLIVYMEK
jgi:hypothetical protein